MSGQDWFFNQVTDKSELLLSCVGVWQSFMWLSVSFQEKCHLKQFWYCNFISRKLGKITFFLGMNLTGVHPVPFHNINFHGHCSHASEVILLLYFKNHWFTSWVTPLSPPTQKQRDSKESTNWIQPDQNWN